MRIGRPSPAMIVALLALFVALAGTAYAALTITGKEVKNKSLSGKDLKKDTLTGKQVNESQLGKVPAAATADTATSAADAQTVGGQPADAFVDANRFSYRFATAAGAQKVTVLERGPYKIELECSQGSSAGGLTWSARLYVTASEPSRSTTASGTETSGGGNDISAGTVRQIGATGFADADTGSAYSPVGGYVDVSGGRTLDVSARLRVNRLGVTGCSAAVNATFNGF
jgi:hypothetical protein